MELRCRSRVLERQERSAFPVPETRPSLVEEKGMVIWGFAGAMRSRSNHGSLPAKAWPTDARGPSQPANIDRCTVIRRHNERAGAGREKYEVPR